MILRIDILMNHHTKKYYALIFFQDVKRLPITTKEYEDIFVLIENIKEIIR